MSPQKTTKNKTTETKTKTGGTKAGGTKSKTGGTKTDRAGAIAAPVPARPPGAGSSEPWMERWLDEAGRASSLDAACEKAGVSLRDVHEARDADPAFDEACRTVDLVMDLRITDSVRAGAARGEIRAQNLYFGRVRDVVLGRHARRIEAILAPDEAEAAIREGLIAAGVRVDHGVSIGQVPYLSLPHAAIPPAPSSSN